MHPKLGIGEDLPAGAPGQLPLSKSIYTPIPGRYSAPISQFSATQPSRSVKRDICREAPGEIYPCEDDFSQPTELLYVGIAQEHPIGLLAPPQAQSETAAGPSSATHRRR